MGAWQKDALKVETVVWPRVFSDLFKCSVSNLNPNNLNPSSSPQNSGFVQTLAKAQLVQNKLGNAIRLRNFEHV